MLQSTGALGAPRSACRASAHQRVTSVTTSAWRPTVERSLSCSSQDGMHPYLSAATSVALAIGMIAAPLNMAFAPPAFALDAEEAVANYQALEVKGKLKSFNQLDDIRTKNGFKRSPDGRVLLKGKSGDWFNVRLDLEVPGAMLLRDGKGSVFAMQTDNLKQIDLSDDYIVMMMFSGGEWEKAKIPLMYTDGEGKEHGLQMEEKDFRQVIGILNQLMGEGGELGASGAKGGDEN